MLRHRLRKKTKGSKGAEDKQKQPHAKPSTQGGAEQALTAFTASSADALACSPAQLTIPGICSSLISGGKKVIRHHKKTDFFKNNG